MVNFERLPRPLLNFLRSRIQAEGLEHVAERTGLTSVELAKAVKSGKADPQHARLLQRWARTESTTTETLDGPTARYLMELLIGPYLKEPARANIIRAFTREVLAGSDPKRENEVRWAGEVLEELERGEGGQSSDSPGDRLA